MATNSPRLRPLLHKKSSPLFLFALLLSPWPSVLSHQPISSFVPAVAPNDKRKRELTDFCHQSNPPKCNTYSSTELSSSTSTASTQTDRDEVRQILRRYGFGSRLLTLTNAELLGKPMPAEMYEGGGWKMCLVLGLKPPSTPSSPNGNEKPPLLDVIAMNDDGLLQDRKVIDIGQITFLWQDFNEQFSIDTYANSFNKAQESLQNSIFPLEQSMQNLYNGRMANRASASFNNRGLTKKQIPKITSHLSNPTHIEELLRNLLKVGEDRMSRMVDSEMATDYLYSDFCRDGDDERIVRRILAAQVLTEDALTGGRFKRRSCQFVSAQYRAANTDVQEVTLVNGGWIAVDPSIKAGTEARRFASVATSKNANNTKDKPLLLTAADERIAHRLECLAMGDVFQSDQQEDDAKMLELDVREALTSMELPLTPNGASEALIKIGRWSESAKKEDSSRERNNLIEPWSPALLDTARSLVLYESKRRESLSKQCYSPNKKSSAKAKAQQRASLADGFEGRMDLSALPCVCIDAKRASFRDDAIGIRLRSSTGRRVNKQASKWEVLIHIADVSDLYFDAGDRNIIVPSKQDLNVHLLRQAAERRGQSRYDLPLGPLHLLPPVALTALSLATNESKTPNRCVTLWAYIDERDGKLIEGGLERTIISSPSALTFADATTLLENPGDVPKSMTNAKAILSVAERNLSLWSERHRQLNQSAQKREKRLSNKEFISNQLNAASGTRTRDDGVGNSFQRSRGHRAVDSSLDLYGFALGTLMSRAKQPIPRAAGSGADRGGRLGTAPLRRYIDGLAQRQALSVLCGYGKPLTSEECKEASKVAALASDNIANLRSSTKQSSTLRGRGSGNDQRQVSALYKLARHLSSTGGIKNQQQVNAMSTGHNNEVVILGVGATARCKRVKGTLKSGEKLLVQVDRIDPEVGILDVSLVRR